MQKILKIIQQSLVFLSGKLFVLFLGLGLKYFLAKNLMDPAHALGLFALGMSLVNIVSPFSTFGFAGSATRFIPKWQVEKQQGNISQFVGSVSLLALFSSLVFAALVWYNYDFLFSFITDDLEKLSDFKPLLLLFVFIMLLKNISDTFAAFLRGFQEVNKTTWYSSYLAFSLKVVLAIAFLYWGWDLKGYVYAELIASVFVSFALGVIVLKLLKGKSALQIGKSFLNPEVKGFASTIFIMSIITMLVNNVDKILLAKMSISELGVYHMSLTFVPFIPMIIASVNSIFAPIISQSWSEGKKEELGQLYQFFTKWTLLLSFPLTFFIVFFSEPLLALFGEEFVSGSIVLIILAIANLFNVSFGSIGMLLQMTGRHFKMLWINIFRAVLILVLMWFLIPLYGLTGAAVASALGIVVVTVLNYLLMYKELSYLPYDKSVWKIVLSMFVGGMLLYIFFNAFELPFELLYLCLYALITFVVMMLSAWVFCISAKDKQISQEIFRRIASK
jgi:O-antigen/teichoic acid export membrane protein